MAKIWNAIDSAENRNELRELVHLADKDNTISWSNFSFSPPRYSELLREVKKTNGHSIAVLVTVQDLHALNDEWIKVECAVARTTDRKRDIRVSPILFVRPHVAGRLAQDKQYIAFGNWRLGRKNPWKSPSGYEIVYQDVTLNVERLAQIAPITVPGEAENV